MSTVGRPKRSKTNAAAAAAAAALAQQLVGQQEGEHSPSPHDGKCSELEIPEETETTFSLFWNLCCQDHQENNHPQRIMSGSHRRRRRDEGALQTELWEAVKRWRDFEGVKEDSEEKGHDVRVGHNGNGIEGTETECKSKDNESATPDDSEGESESSDSTTAAQLDKIFYLFEQWEPKTSWENRNTEAFVFMYAAFCFGCECYQQTSKELHSAGDEKGYVPNMTIIESLAEVVDTHALSDSMINFALWYMIGFEKLQALHQGKNHTTTTASASKRRASRILTIAEFEQKVPHDQVTSPGCDSSSECCIFVSHRWASKTHPDADGTQQKLVCSILRKVQDWIDCIRGLKQTSLMAKLDRHFTASPQNEEGGDDADPSKADFVFCKIATSDEFQWAIRFFVNGQHQVKVWYDYYSVPQGKDVASKSIRSKCLDEIAPLCQRMMFLGLVMDDYFSRGWCVFEMVQNMLGASPLGTKLVSANKVALGINVQALEYSEQLDMQFYMQLIHGRFCRLIETQEDDRAMVLLDKLGISCTNGSDMNHLSNLLYEQIKACPKENLITWIHPVVSAVTRMLELSSPLPDKESTDQQTRPLTLSKSFKAYCSKWRDEKRTNGQLETPEVLSARVELRWRYPDYCLDYLLETRKDLTIPGYNEQVEAALLLLHDLMPAFENIKEQDSWDDIIEKVGIELGERIVHVGNAAGHFVQLSFASPKPDNVRPASQVLKVQ